MRVYAFRTRLQSAPHEQGMPAGSVTISVTPAKGC
jgi:hypothetical protein